MDPRSPSDSVRTCERPRTLLHARPRTHTLALALALALALDFIRAIADLGHMLPPMLASPPTTATACNCASSKFHTSVQASQSPRPVQTPLHLRAAVTADIVESVDAVPVVHNDHGCTYAQFQNSDFTLLKASVGSTCLSRAGKADYLFVSVWRTRDGAKHASLMLIKVLPNNIILSITTRTHLHARKRGKPAQLTKVYCTLYRSSDCDKTNFPDFTEPETMTSFADDDKLPRLHRA
eukprot:910950-Pleurochrysis_carterae.AAC.7